MTQIKLGSTVLSRFSFPEQSMAPRLMAHLTDQILSSRSTLHPIELAAMAHKRLVDIHPFIDGNVTQRHLQKAA
ncbi:MAG: Fic family protein [Lachnospiraceae bacterium]|nr:Fic family protein [Lachnospiraceae bacterium]